VSDGTTCDDGNASTKNDVCTAGACGGVGLCSDVTCTALDQCHVTGTCDPATGKCSDPNKADGAACDDGNASTKNDVCTAGSCGGVGLCSDVTCKALDECHDVGTCDPTDGTCSNPAKPDGKACTGGTCQGGTCVPTTPDAGSGGNDAGTSNDAGTTFHDAGSTNGGDDAGTNHNGNDAGDIGVDDAGSTNVADSGAHASDSGTTDDGGIPGLEPDTNAGCSCKVSNPSAKSEWGWFGAAAFGLVVSSRRRSRATSKSAR
jgi:MYXO-CTERM domain-containing protein